MKTQPKSSNNVPTSKTDTTSNFRLAAVACLGVAIVMGSYASAMAGGISTAEWYDTVQQPEYNNGSYHNNSGNYDNSYHSRDYRDYYSDDRNSGYEFSQPLNYDQQSDYRQPAGYPSLRDHSQPIDYQQPTDYRQPSSYGDEERPRMPRRRRANSHRSLRPVSNEEQGQFQNYRQQFIDLENLQSQQNNGNVDFDRYENQPRHMLELRDNYDMNSRHRDQYRNEMPALDYRSPNLNDYRQDHRAPQEIRRRYPNIDQYQGNDGSVSKPEPTELEKIQARVASRYGNPVVGRFVQNMSTEQLIGVYGEVSQMIDQRHLEPVSYADRTGQAIKNLTVAIADPAFQRTNNISLSPQQIESFRRELIQMAGGQSISNSNEAQQFMYKAMQTGQSRLGLKPSAVVLEFIYASVESLDKYSAFLPEDQARRPSASLEDHLVGIGVEIKPDDEGVRIVRPLRGGPAAEAGLQNNDIIVGINGKSLRGQTIDFAADLIAGPEGSQLRIDVLRDGRQIQPITLMRRRVNVYSVSEVRMLDEAVGYIRLDKFAESSTEEVDRALWDLYRKGMKSLVFDVRGNPGGLLTTAISLSDKFLPGGNIVSTRGRTTADQSSEQAHYEQTWRVPLVVLVDGNSASASEIFAAAIQENGRGLVVGRKSYGKGTVQTHFPLRSVSANLKLTTARFYSPNGRQMAGNGVTPDINVGGRDEDLEGFSMQDRDIQAGLQAAQSRQVYEMAKDDSNLSNGLSGR